MIGICEKRKKKKEFSKVLLLQESILVWIITISCIIMAFICIFRNSFVELPWITAIVGFPWGAYGVSQAFYYKKSEKENTKDYNNNINSSICNLFYYSTWIYNYFKKTWL